MASVALGGKSTSGLMLLFRCVGWCPARWGSVIHPKCSAALPLLMGWAGNLLACSLFTPSELGHTSIPYKTGSILSLDYAEDALRSCPVSFSELSRKFLNQTHLSSGKAEPSGFYLRHTGTRGCLETQIHALPPNHTPGSL